MRIRTAATIAFTAGSLALAAIPGAQAQNNYGDAYGPNYAPPGQTVYGPPYARNFAPHRADISEPYPYGTYGSTTPQTLRGNQSNQGYSWAPSSAGTSGTEVVTTGPSTYHPPPGYSPRENRMESQHYVWLLQHDRNFRQARMRKECGPLVGTAMHDNCVQSFDQYSPFLGSATGYGSSTAPNYYGSNYGR